MCNTMYSFAPKAVCSAPTISNNSEHERQKTVFILPSGPRMLYKLLCLEEATARATQLGSLYP